MLQLALPLETGQRHQLWTIRLKKPFGLAIVIILLDPQQPGSG